MGKNKKAIMLRKDTPLYRSVLDYCKKVYHAPEGCHPVLIRKTQDIVCHLLLSQKPTEETLYKTQPTILYDLWRNPEFTEQTAKYVQFITSLWINEDNIRQRLDDVCPAKLDIPSAQARIQCRPNDIEISLTFTDIPGVSIQMYAKYKTDITKQEAEIAQVCDKVVIAQKLTGQTNINAKEQVRATLRNIYAQERMNTFGMSDNIMQTQFGTLTIPQPEIDKILNKYPQMIESRRINGLKVYTYQSEISKPLIREECQLLLKTFGEKPQKLQNPDKPAARKIMCQLIGETRIDDINWYASNPLANALLRIQKPTVLSVWYTPNENIYTIKTTYADITNTKNKWKLINHQPLGDLIHKLGSVSFQKQKMFLEDMMHEYEMSDIRLKKGRGITAGDSTVQLTDGEFTCQQKIIYQHSITEWRKEVKAAFIIARQDIDAKRLIQKQYRQKEILPVLGSFLAYDIAEFIAANEDHITAAATIQAMRGTKIKLSTHITKTPGCGKYNLLDENEIQKEINRMISCNVLKERSVTGVYRTYTLLKKGRNHTAFLHLYAEPYEDKLQNDLEALMQWNNIKTECTEEHCLRTAELLSYHGFACRYIDEIVEYLSQAGSSIADYLQIAELTEDNQTTSRLMKYVRTKLAT